MFILALPPANASPALRIGFGRVRLPPTGRFRTYGGGRGLRDDVSGLAPALLAQAAAYGTGRGSGDHPRGLAGDGLRRWGRVNRRGFGADRAGRLRRRSRGVLTAAVRFRTVPGEALLLGLGRRGLRRYRGGFSRNRGGHRGRWGSTRDVTLPGCSRNGWPLRPIEPLCRCLRKDVTSASHPRKDVIEAFLLGGGVRAFTGLG